MGFKSLSAETLISFSKASYPHWCSVWIAYTVEVPCIPEPQFNMHSKERITPIKMSKVQTRCSGSVLSTLKKWLHRKTALTESTTFYTKYCTFTTKKQLLPYSTYALSRGWNTSQICAHRSQRLEWAIASTVHKLFYIFYFFSKSPDWFLTKLVRYNSKEGEQGAGHEKSYFQLL